MGQFMKKKGHSARKRRDHNKEYVRRCYKCKSKGHVVADCPYNSNNDEDEKKKEKKEKKKNDKKMTFKKNKKGDDCVVTWDSDASLDSNDDKKSMKNLRHLQVSPSTTSLLSSTLHRHASWLSPLR
jgi:hypothetical protein